MSRTQSLRSLYMDSSSKGWLVDIDDYYLQSSVSYYGLTQYVPRHFSKACSIVKGRYFNLSGLNDRQYESLADACRTLYGMLHQRYIVTEDGVRKLHSKYSKGVYGVCPRAACKGRHLIPMGFSAEPRQDKVKLWCPQCHDVYNSNSDIDGAYFGPDLPVMFHKIADIPLKFRSFSTFLEKRKDENGNDVPAIRQRLYRWGEKKI